MRTFKTVTVLAVGTAVMLACDPTGDTGSDDTGNGSDVVISAGMSRSGTQETHYVHCGPSAGGEPEYEVVVDSDYAYGDIEGETCPDGERLPLPQDEHPELYEEMSEALNEPLPYEGGDIETCGAWGVELEEQAKELAAECGPVTRWDGEPVTPGSRPDIQG